MPMHFMTNIVLLARGLLSFTWKWHSRFVYQWKSSYIHIYTEKSAVINQIKRGCYKPDISGEMKTTTTTNEVKKKKKKKLKLYFNERHWCNKHVYFVSKYRCQTFCTFFSRLFSFFSIFSLSYYSNLSAEEKKKK